MYQMCHIPRQDVIESDRIKKSMFVCVCVVRGGGGGGGGYNAIGLSIIMHFLCRRSRTRLKKVSEIWNLDLNLDLDLDLTHFLCRSMQDAQRSSFPSLIASLVVLLHSITDLRIALSCYINLPQQCHDPLLKSSSS